MTFEESSESRNRTTSVAPSYNDSFGEYPPLNQKG
jgi:hypothetical protein